MYLAFVVWYMSCDKVTSQPFESPNGNGSVYERLEQPMKASKPISKLDMYKLIFDNLYGGSAVVDRNGTITHFSKTYSQYLGISPEEAIGKHCTELIENSRLHIVAKTGKPEIAAQFFLNGKNMITHRIPIYHEGEVVAVLGQMVLKDVNELKSLTKQLSILESKVKLYEQELINLRKTQYSIDSIIGDSPSMKMVKNEAMKASSNHFSVLVTGESGTGKEVLAQAIHHSGDRSVFPFVRINCAAIPRELFESEFFGYEKGAFTGANTSGKIGKLELANHGTLFLDEIGDLPLDLQPKLLRVLEDKAFERVGGNNSVLSDFRIIAATNKDLEQMMEKGYFRPDLYYRLSVIPIKIPPLRERKTDISLLAEHFLEKIAADINIKKCHISKAAMEILAEYKWLGNGRELYNVLERMVCSLIGNTIQLDDIPPYIKQKTASSRKYAGKTLKDIKKLAEKDAICNALRETGNNKVAAAMLLGIHRSLLYKKMNLYGIA